MGTYNFMHPYEGKAYNPNCQSPIKIVRHLTLRYLQLLCHLLGIRLKPSIINYSLYRFYQLNALSGIHYWQDIQTLYER